MQLAAKACTVPSPYFLKQASERICPTVICAIGVRLFFYERRWKIYFV